MIHARCSSRCMGTVTNEVNTVPALMYRESNLIYVPHYSSIFPTNHDLDIIIPVVQVRKLRLRKMNFPKVTQLVNRRT